EPTTYSYADLEREGRTVWDGVSNNLALKYIRQIQAGDQAFIYHTGTVKAIVGIATVISDPYGDPHNSKLVVFDLVPQRLLPRPVTLAEVKAHPAFADSLLVKNARLSVMPMTADQWQLILNWAGDQAATKSPQ
ncbi:MAG: EVE domain-containing protein, partial [Thermostichales cyanobacterium DRC_bins_46]